MEIITDTNKFIGGWFVGNFSPAAYKTDQFEVCYKIHHKDEAWPTHYHAVSTEINYLLEGHMKINDIEMFAPTVFIIFPNEISKPTFFTECKLIVIKTPSIPSDKFNIED